MAKRGKTPSLLTGSSGNPSIVTAKRKRICRRCNCNINKGEKLFEIPKIGSGFSEKKSMCKLCFGEILDQTRKDLDALETACRNKMEEEE